MRFWPLLSPVALACLFMAPASPHDRAINAGDITFGRLSGISLRRRVRRLNSAMRMIWKLYGRGWITFNGRCRDWRWRTEICDNGTPGGINCNDYTDYKRNGFYGCTTASTRVLGICGDTGSYSWARSRLELWFYQELGGENVAIR